MSFRVQTNVAALNAASRLGETSRSLQRVTGRLSSGYRVNSAADDAAGLAIANRFRADIRSYKVAQRNIAEATSMVQITEGAVAGVENILERMKELATQAASANASTQLGAIDSEYQALVSEIDRAVAASNYQGQALIDGTFSGLFQVGPTNASADQLNVDLSTANLSTTALGGAADHDGSTVVGDAGDFVAGTDLSSQANAQIALAVLDDAITQANGVLGDLGAYQNRLDYAAANISTTILNYQASESVIRDADMAQEMVEFSKLSILQQTGVSMLAQANAAPQAVLSLL